MSKLTLNYDKFSFDVDPKDLLFLAVSGSHSYGTNKPDSDLDLRGVFMPSFRDAIQIQGSSMKTEFYKLTPDIDVEFVPIRKWLQILLKGNGNYLENLWQTKVYPRSRLVYYKKEAGKERDIIKLKQLVMQYGLSKKFRNHYIGFAKSQQKDFFQKYKTKCLLYVYRVLLSGIILYKRGVVEFNLPKIINTPEYRVCYPISVTKHVDLLLSNFDNEKSLVNDIFKSRVQTDFDELEHTLNMYADASDLPDKPNYEPFNDWLENWYLSERQS